MLDLQVTSSDVAKPALTSPRSQQSEGGRRNPQTLLLFSLAVSGKPLSSLFLTPLAMLCRGANIDTSSGAQGAAAFASSNQKVDLTPSLAFSLAAARFMTCMYEHHKLQAASQASSTASRGARRMLLVPGWGESDQTCAAAVEGIHPGSPDLVDGSQAGAPCRTSPTVALHQAARGKYRRRRPEHCYRSSAVLCISLDQNAPFAPLPNAHMLPLCSVSASQCSFNAVLMQMGIVRAKPTCAYCIQTETPLPCSSSSPPFMMPCPL